MSHSPEQSRKKAEARAEAMHHHKNMAVDGKHDDMPMHERMYKSSDMAPKYRAESAHEQESERRKVYSED